MRSKCRSPRSGSQPPAPFCHLFHTISNSGAFPIWSTAFEHVPLRVCVDNARYDVFAASFLHRQKGIPPKRNAQRQITLELAAKSGGTRYLPRGNGDFPPPSAGGCDDLLPFGWILPAAK